METYEYKGDEDKVYYDRCGNRHVLSKGDLIKLKYEPEWDTIVSRTVEKKRYMRKMNNDSGD